MKAKLLSSILVAGIAGWTGTAAAVQAVGPICDSSAKVNHTTYYYCSTNYAYHAALDIGNGTCNTWLMRGMLVGSYKYTVKKDCGSYCNGSSCANSAVVSGFDTWNFGQYHMSPNANSYTKTCDRCSLGLVGGTGNATGPHVHAENRYNGAKHIAWYSGYVTCGSSGYCVSTVGYPRLSN